MLETRNRSVRKTLALFAALFAMMAALPSIAVGQGGRITGTITGADNRPIADAQVTLVNTSYRAVSDASGAFSISGVPVGRYEMRVQRIGERPRTVAIDVAGTGDSRADVQLTRAPIELSGVVVSASRRAEKITDAPATVTRIEGTAIDNSAGGSAFASALKGAKGLDFVQIGMTAVAVNARGFNSSFNNRMLLMEDGRISVLPESGLPLGLLSAIPKVDLASAEVLVGPGSALYGPDASNGVITLSTRDPRAYPGVTVELTGGNRSYRDLQGRYAWAGGAFGFKASGEYQSANDFSNVLNYGPVAPRTTRTAEQPVDWNTSVARGNGSLVWYGAPGRLEFNGGYAKVDGIGQTSVGRNQLIGYNAGHLQLRFANPRVYANAYRIETGSGDTYAINAYSQNKLAFPTLTDDSIKNVSGFPGGGSLTAAEIQGNYELLGTRLVAGGQIRHDQVSSKRRWLSDRLTGEDVKINQKGVYAQTETPLGPMLRLVMAARYDDHERYSEQFSPKAALLLTPVESHTFRFSFNRAFKSPSILQTDFYIPNFALLGPALGIGVVGNQGLTVRNAAGTIEQTYEPIKPEVNTTYELGYKGIIRNRMFVDITGYQSKFKDFLTPLTTLNNLFRAAAAGGPTYVHLANGERFVGPNNSQQLTLSYLNIGNATMLGTDMGLRYLITDRIGADLNYSFVQLKPLKILPTQTALLEATALNSPKHKGTLTIDWNEIPANWWGSFVTRTVTGFSYRSGAINTGRIAGFTAADLNLGYRLPFEGMQVKASVQNLFSCSSGRYNIPATVAPPGVFEAERKCGFGQKHTELINMPEIGTMVFVGLRWAFNPTMR